MIALPLFASNWVMTSIDIKELNINLGNVLKVAPLDVSNSQFVIYEEDDNISLRIIKENDDIRIHVCTGKYQPAINNFIANKCFFLTEEVMSQYRFINIIEEIITIINRDLIIALANNSFKDDLIAPVIAACFSYSMYSIGEKFYMSGMLRGVFRRGLWMPAQMRSPVMLAHFLLALGGVKIYQNNKEVKEWGSNTHILTKIKHVVDEKEYFHPAIHKEEKNNHIMIEIIKIFHNVLIGEMA